MTPTPEQVVAACQRAGIPVAFFDKKSREIRHLPPPDDIYFKIDPFGGYVITSEDDTNPGSALFIVAVSGALENRRCSIGYIDGKGVVRWLQRPVDSFHTEATDDTLTAACMAAIVAAFPEEVGE